MVWLIFFASEPEGTRDLLARLSYENLHFFPLSTIRLKNENSNLAKIS
jgi:hypothetical protein